MTSGAPSTSAIERAGFWLRVLASAAPLAFVAFAYARVRATGEPFLGLDAKALGVGASIEFIVLHSIGFLGILALIRPPRAEWAALKWFAVGLLGALYLGSAHQMGGRQGLLLFVSLTFTTYLGFFLVAMRPGAAFSLALRWLLSLLLLMIASGIAGLDSNLDEVNWSAPEEGLRFGQWFFALLLAVELTGLYHRPFWDVLGRHARATHGEMFPASRDTVRQRLTLGVLPLAGTAVLCALPLFIAQAIGAGFFELIYRPPGGTLDERVAWMRASARLHEWGPLIVTAPLMLARGAQIVWITGVLRPVADRPWWRRRGLLALLGALGALYVAAAWSHAAQGGTFARAGVSPAGVLQIFILIEMFALPVLLAQGWRAIVRRLRGA